MNKTIKDTLKKMGEKLTGRKKQSAENREMLAQILTGAGYTSVDATGALVSNKSPLVAPKVVTPVQSAEPTGPAVAADKPKRTRRTRQPKQAVDEASTASSPTKVKFKTAGAESGNRGAENRLSQLPQNTTRAVVPVSAVLENLGLSDREKRLIKSYVRMGFPLEEVVAEAKEYLGVSGDVTKGYVADLTKRMGFADKPYEHLVGHLQTLGQATERTRAALRQRTDATSTPG